MTDTLAVESCSCSDAFLQRDASKEVHPDAGGRSVGNTHLTQAEHLTAFFLTGVDQVDSYVDGLIELGFRHSWTMKEVLSASGYLAVENRGEGCQVVVYAYVDQLQIEAMLATEHIDTTSTSGEVDHLLPGDLTR